MTNRYTNLFRFFFVCVDLVSLSLVHIMLILNFHRIPLDGERPYGLLFLVNNMVWLISAYSVGLYIEDGQPNVYRFSKRTLKAFILFACCVMMFAFLYHYPYSRLFILINFAGFFVLLMLTRISMVIGTYFMQKANHVSRRIVIIGYNDLSKKFVERFIVNHKDFQVDGYFEDQPLVNELSRHPIIGNINECIDYAVKYNIQEIYSAISPEKNESIYEMAKQAEKSLIRFKFIPDFRLFVNRETYLEYQGNFPILSLRPEPLEDMGNSLKKRTFDIVFSLFVIICILSWLIPILAILIVLSSRGSVFFKQKRSGKNNKQFTCYKLRTMTLNNEANTKQVTLNDSRVTRLGRFLRKTNLDEMPQFVNVLLGNMSVVGPRPHMLVHTSMYSKVMGEYMIRHFLKPGITGWAQVNGYRGEIKDEDQLRRRINHDIWYMENWSIWLDMKIILLTIYTTFKGDKNAY
ncbi:MAG: undecaprenyl-phosphate glucose phosphotransferase [Bacteroidota bacterium]|nr:undecaprenyl-phosphate glucose phosphotransferase [Bacteroidota bacterium]